MTKRWDLKREKRNTTDAVFFDQSIHSSGKFTDESQWQTENDVRNLKQGDLFVRTGTNILGISRGKSNSSFSQDRSTVCVKKTNISRHYLLALSMEKVCIGRPR